jgi:hypothetical protein
MARPYTERLLRWAATGTARVTIPAGYRAVLRNVDVYNGAASAQQFSVNVNGYSVMFRTLQAQTDVHIETRSVAYSGEYIEIWIQGAGGTVVITGYVFEDPTGPTIPREAYAKVVTKPVEELPWP